MRPGHLIPQSAFLAEAQRVIESEVLGNVDMLTLNRTANLSPMLTLSRRTTLPPMPTLGLAHPEALHQSLRHAGTIPGPWTVLIVPPLGWAGGRRRGNEGGLGAKPRGRCLCAAVPD